MADAMQASCAAPVFKRPRLDYSPCESDTLISFESVSSEERFSVDSGLQEDSYEVTSSSDCHFDHHESVPPLNQGLTAETNGVHSSSSACISETAAFEHCIQNDFMTDNSNDHEVLNGMAAASNSEISLDENEIEDQDSSISSMNWVQRQMVSGMDPRLILNELLPKGTFVPQNVNDGLLWRFIVNMLNEPKRSKLTNVNTLDDAVQLLKTCRNVIVLTGAGVSVSCGIPDFRSKNGVYARLSKDYPDLPDPQAMFDINYFRRDPRPFFKFAKEIYPGQFEPSPSHRFIKVLEKQNKLLRNYTQNIDTLEHAAGIQNVITCHGSFATATCTVCSYKVDSSVIKEDIFNQRIPYCPICPAEAGTRGIMKPDIVFFGEGLSDEFHDALAHDKETCDLLIVMGSSLKVRPVAMIPSSIPTNVPQILINREPLKQLNFDIELLGDCDVIIGELCRRLEDEWKIDDTIPRQHLKEINALPPPSDLPPHNEDTSADCQSAAEVNNNHSITTGESRNLPQNDESNSCEYKGLSAIKLDDSEDGSNQEKPLTDPCSTNQELPELGNAYSSFWPLSSRESLSKRLPDKSFLYFPPSRYIFEGAEVYQDEDDDCCSTSTDYSSDSDSPSRPTTSENLPTEEVMHQNQFTPLDDVHIQSPVVSENTDSGHPSDSPKT
nr:NAD-dependent protein deacetylase sirtuin-1 isoform X3 [Parasteatoda tepidariorum]